MREAKRIRRGKGKWEKNIQKLLQKAMEMNSATSAGTERVNASVPCLSLQNHALSAAMPFAKPLQKGLPAVETWLQCTYTDLWYLKPEAVTSSRAAVSLYSAWEAKLKSKLPQLCDTWHPRQRDYPGLDILLQAALIQLITLQCLLAWPSVGAVSAKISAASRYLLRQ